MGAPPIIKPPGGAPPPPPNPQPSVIQTSPPLVSFNPKEVVPAQIIYLQRNDSLAFNTLGNVQTYTLRVDYRFLTPEGEIKEGELTFGTSSGVAFVGVPIFEGWLLSFTVRMVSGASAGYWVFLQALTLRSSLIGTAGPAHGLIWQGFVPQNAANGWPGTPAKEITDGAGVIHSITGTTPNPGADISENIPLQRRWTLLAFRAKLTASAAVANRVPIIVYDDGVNIFYQSANSINQTAGAIITYSLGQVIPTAAPFNGDVLLIVPANMQLKAGGRIRTNTSGLQAADQWTAPQYLVQEWGAWDA